MREQIQNNITLEDLAHDVKLRIDFVKGISDQDLSTIESKLHNIIVQEVKVGFGSAIGKDFIAAAILNFGHEANFETLKKCIYIILIPYHELIEQISYHKSELIQSTYQFVA